MKDLVKHKIAKEIYRMAKHFYGDAWFLFLLCVLSCFVIG